MRARSTASCHRRSGSCTPRCCQPRSSVRRRRKGWRPELSSRNRNGESRRMHERTSAIKSGWSDSNRRLPRPKRGTLTRLSYTPSMFERPHSMTVCANGSHLAIFAMIVWRLWPLIRRPRSPPLQLPWEVVPVHRRVVKSATIRRRKGHPRVRDTTQRAPCAGDMPAVS